MRASCRTATKPRSRPSSPPEHAAPAAPPHELEPEGSRWAGWWKDDLPATPKPEREALEAAIASLPAALAAMLVLRDVEGLEAAEVEALFGHSPDRQIAFLQHGRTAVRNALRTSAAEASRDALCQPLRPARSSGVARSFTDGALPHATRRASMMALRSDGVKRTRSVAARAARRLGGLARC